VNGQTASRIDGQTRRVLGATPATPQLGAHRLDAMPEHAPTQFVVQSILPRRHVTLLAGHGGSGKSTLALAIAAHVACGREWAGLDVEPGHCVFLSLEDEVGICGWRLRKIAAAYGLSVERLAQNLTLLDGVTCDAALAAERAEYGNVRLVPTPAMAELADAARGCSLVVIDNAADALLGDANSQAIVRTFMRRLLGKLARETDSAVLLLAHIDKHAARNGAQGNAFFGSVAWHNSARSRLALTEAPGAMLELGHEKSNLCRRIQSVRLAFTPEGIPMPLQAPNAQDVADATAQHAEALLGVIDAATGQGQDVVLARTGTATTQRQLDTVPGFPPELRGSAGRLEFWAALDSLIKNGRLQAAPFTNSRRKNRVRLSVAPDVVCAVAPLRSSPIPPRNGALEGRTAAPFAPFANGAQTAQNGATAQAIPGSEPVMSNECEI